MKGQYQPLTAILITAVVLTAASSIYFWGLPIIQKSKDNINLENTENLLKTINDKIKSVAMNGNIEKTPITTPAVVTFDNVSEIISVMIKTEGTIYAEGGWIQLSENATCLVDVPGTLGIHVPEIMCVSSQKIAKRKYNTEFILRYRQLNIPDTGKSIRIKLVGEYSKGSQGRQIVIKNLGHKEINNVINTLIEINII